MLGVDGRCRDRLARVELVGYGWCAVDLYGFRDEFDVIIAVRLIKGRVVEVVE